MILFGFGFLAGVVASLFLHRHWWEVYMEMHPDVKAVWEKSERVDKE